MKNQESLSQRRSMRSEIAKRHIEAFSKRFGEDHLILAQHAAFPLALTPDLLYLLWANFRYTIRAPWIAVADLLLSGLCDEVGHELYEMNTGVRSILLNDLKHKFGPERVNELSNFILNYIEQQLESDDFYIRDLASTQRWIALAYIRPGEAAHEIAKALRTSIEQKDHIEQIRMADLIETTAEPLADFAPLLTYARGIAHLIQNDIQSAQAQFSKIVEQESTISIQGVRLPIPVQMQATIQNSVQQQNISYVSAKVVLLGDSGVGKSGLGYRIAKGRFQITESTHGQQFWVVDKLGKTRDDGTICEVVLRDFAGQPNFRLIHDLFLDDVDLALILFDPSRQDTFAGVEYWLKQLSYKERQCSIVLVAARSDVSKLSIPRAELTNYCREKNITGGFILTSAKTGTGIAALLKIIQREIDWNAKPTTTTTETFKRIKDHVLALKANAERKNVLVAPAQLRTQLEKQDSEWDFADAEMMGAVGHLQNHGYVTILRSSSETQSILLAPDLLINLAASYMLKAQANERGLGSLEEARALRNDYRFPELKNLKWNERDTLLNAVTELFLERNICYRESIDKQTFLIFPSLILERPVQITEDVELVEDTTYIIKGVVENLYPTLVVLLGYSPSFQRVYQWRKQAQYEMVSGEICGFKLANVDPTMLELVLYYGKDTPPYVRSRFQGLFEEILYKRDVLIEKYGPLFCPKCKRQQERRIVIRHLQDGKSFLFCDEDGKKIALPSTIERIALSPQERTDIIRNRTLSQMRTTYEIALVRIKGFLRDQGSKAAPTCFFSYAWGVPEHERQVLKLADDLRNADIHVILDQGNNQAIGSSVARFISSIEQSDYILVIGTPSYREKYENKVSQYGSVVAAEVDLIHVRLISTEAQKVSVLPVLLAGEKHSSFPPFLHDRVYGDFTQEEFYFVTLFNLVLTLYHIPFDDALVRDLQIKLKEDAEALLTTGTG